MQDEKSIVKTVQDQYAAVARSGLSNDSQAVRSVAAAFGYTEEELAGLPAEANMGLSCGNPVAIASLRPGEVVVDLGCGGGIDVLLAARKVGPTGKAIGVDMTADMLQRARPEPRRSVLRTSSSTSRKSIRCHFQTTPSTASSATASSIWSPTRLASSAK